MKLLFVTFEIGTDGRFFSEGAGAIKDKTNVSVYKRKQHWLIILGNTFHCNISLPSVSST